MAILTLAAIGILGGFASGLFGVGGGVLFVPLLVLLRGFDAHRAIGTSLAVIVPTAMVAAWRHSLSGAVEWKSAFLIFFFSMLGAWFGSLFSLQLDAVLLRRFFALFLILLAFKMFFQRA